MDSKSNIFYLNFPSKYTNIECDCGEAENMEQIYNCEKRGERSDTSYENIYKGNIQEQIRVFETFLEKSKECIVTTM